MELDAAFHQFLVIDAGSTFDFSAVWDDYASQARLAAFPGGLLVGTATDGMVTVEVDGRTDPPPAAGIEGSWSHVTTAGIAASSGRLEVMGVRDEEPAAVVDLAPLEYAVEVRFDDAQASCVLVLWPEPGAGQWVRVPLPYDAEELRGREVAWRSRMEAVWPGRATELLVWELGRLRARFPHVRTLRLAPSATDPHWLYVSVGAWALPPGADRSPEFALRSRREDPLLVELMAMLADRQSVAGALEAGSVMPIGRPWIEGSCADHVLLAAASAVLGVPDELGLLAVLPLYPSEADWVHEHGADALLARLGAPEILADPARAAIV